MSDLDINVEHVIAGRLIKEVWKGRDDIKFWTEDIDGLHLEIKISEINDDKFYIKNTDRGKIELTEIKFINTLRKLEAYNKGEY